MPAEAPLAGNGRLNRVLGATEGDEERVALRIDNVAARLVDGGLDELAMQG